MNTLRFALLAASTAVAALPAGAAAQRAPLELPIVVIAAPNGVADEPKRDATMQLYDRDRRAHYSGRIGIEQRGYGSQRFPKKSFAVETRKDSGANRNVPLLGMPSDDDWVLIANYRDESLIRNYVAYETSRWLGQYAADTRLVEVVLNGKYEGVYLLAEQLKLQDSRVAVDDSDVTGGYLLHMISNDRTSGEQFFRTPVKRQAVAYKDPNDPSLGRAVWIRKYVSRFERALYGDRFRDRRYGYRRYLDVDAAVDYVLLNELFRNQATFRYSTHMYKGVGGKLVLGPIWDFDLAIGNSDSELANQLTGWHYGDWPWAERLYADPGFWRRMATRWSELRARGIEGQIMGTIDRGAAQLAGGPQKRNFARWPVFERTRDRPPPDPRTGLLPANYGDGIGYLKWWVAERAEWMDSALGS